MRKQYLWEDYLEEYCIKNDIVKWSGEWFTLKDAYIYQYESLSKGNMIEICLTSSDYENYLKNIRWTFPFSFMLTHLGWNRERFINRQTEIALEVWCLLTEPKIFY